jgi:thiol-disulfide isomerase/thioredoxin
MKRLAGGAVVTALMVMLVLNLVWIGKNRKSLGGTRAGQTAPALSLPLLDGGNANLADWRGKVVFLSFWATWCGPCVRELPDVQRLADGHKDAVFLTINVEGQDAAPKIRAFRQRVGLALPIALDDGAASQAYRVDTIPRTVIVGSDGNIAESLDGARSFDDLRSSLESVH